MLVSLLRARRLPRLAALFAVMSVSLTTLLSPPSAVSARQRDDGTTTSAPSTIGTESPDIGLLEGGVVQVRPGYVPSGSTAPPMGPVLGPSPTVAPNEWSSVGLAVLLTVTPLVTVAALFWLSRKPLPSTKR